MSGKIELEIIYLSNAIDDEYFKTHIARIPSSEIIQYIRSIEKNGLWIENKLHIPAHCIRSERIV